MNWSQNQNASGVKFPEIIGDKDRRFSVQLFITAASRNQYPSWIYIEPWLTSNCKYRRAIRRFIFCWINSSQNCELKWLCRCVQPINHELLWISISYLPRPLFAENINNTVINTDFFGLPTAAVINFPRLWKKGVRKRNFHPGTYCSRDGWTSGKKETNLTRVPLSERVCYMHIEKRLNISEMAKTTYKNVQLTFWCNFREVDNLAHW